MKTLFLLLIVSFAFCDAHHRRKTCIKNSPNGGDVIAQSTRGFANKFLQVVAKDNPGNLICSALSAQIVLAMAAYGAGGTTATQMRSVLEIPSDDQLGLSGYRSFITTLGNETSVVLDIANKVFTASQFQVKAAYQELTTTYFLSSTQALDILGNPTQSAQIVNDWCAQQTNNRITDIITADTLTPDVLVILVNAVYFKGQWDQKFDPTLTQDRPFHVDAQTTKNVPTMYIRNDSQLVDLPEVNAILLSKPYVGKDVSMVIILPNEIDGLQNVLNNLDKVNLTESLGQTREIDSEIYLPKFKIETTLDLKQSLIEIGMSEMFEDSANFSGISDVALKIAKVIQKGFIEVNEDGTEAAVVTVVTGVGSGVPMPPQQIVIDRPFMYVIYHNILGVALFSGTVHDPSLV